jgi:hypothetical protein
LDDVHAKVAYFKHCLEHSKSNQFKELSHIYIVKDLLNMKTSLKYSRSKRDYRQMTNNTDQQAFASTEDDTEQKGKHNNQQAHLVNNTNNKQDKSKLTCTYCNKGGHTRETCFDLVPYPICGVK